MHVSRPIYLSIYPTSKVEQSKPTFQTLRVELIFNRVQPLRKMKLKRECVYCRFLMPSSCRVGMRKQALVMLSRQHKNYLSIHQICYSVPSSFPVQINTLVPDLKTICQGVYMVPLMAPSDFQKLWLRSHSASADNSNQTSAVC